MTRWIWKAVIIFIALLAVGLIVFLAWPKPSISSKIRQQLTSTLLLPTGTQYHIVAQTVTYDTNLKLLTYTVTLFGQKAVISEQPTPEQFTDIPAVYQKVLSSMNDYYDFGTPIGTVHLTQPKQLNGKQAAVLNSDGTLVFAKPSGNLNKSQWGQFFDSFEAAH